MAKDLREFREQNRQNSKSQLNESTLELPAGTEHVVWVCPRPLRDNGSTTLFQPSDELPEGVYERVLPAFNDRVAFLDEAGERLDSENEFEARDAIVEWREETFADSED